MLPTAARKDVRVGAETYSCKLDKKQRILMYLLAIVVVLIVLSLTLAIVLVIRFQHVENMLDNMKEKDSSLDMIYDADNATKEKSDLEIVSRANWLAQPPVKPSDPLVVPVPYVIISHTATENCSSQAQCVFHVRYIQTFHMERRNWWDIGYNFLVGGDGEAYEGRGWTSVGAHTYGYNAKSIGIAFIGTFITVKPPERQMRACKLLIQKGVELGYIKKDYKLLAAKQLYATSSPGEMLYEELKTWNHWAPYP